MSKLIQRVAYRYTQKMAKEFSNQDALDTYLKEHPKANPKNHSVRSKKPGQSETSSPTPTSTKKKTLGLKDIPVGGSAVGLPLQFDASVGPPPRYNELTGESGAKRFQQIISDVKTATKAAETATRTAAMPEGIRVAEQLGLTGDAAERHATAYAGKLASKAGKKRATEYFLENHLAELADPAIHAYQMTQALAPHVDKKVKYKPLSSKPLKKGSAALKSIKTNGLAVSRRFASLIGPNKQRRMGNAVDAVMETLEQALSDGSLGKVTEQEVSDMLVSSMEQLVYQDMESSKRFLSDHGVRHVVSNMDSTGEILDALEKGGTQISGADRLAAALVMLHHDIGYTTPAAKDAAPGTILMKQHPEMSRTLVSQNPFWERAFGDKAEYYLRGMATHSQAGTDWKGNPWESAVRLADNTAVFSEEKLPDLLAEDPRTAKILGRMLLAQRSGGPRRFGENEWENKDAQKTFERLQQELIEVVDTTDYPEDIKTSLKESVKKDVGAMTPEFLLSMYGGRKEGYSLDTDEDGNPLIKVSIAATPERQVLDSLFGHVADFQTERLLGDYDVSGDIVEGGLRFRDLPDVEFRGKKPTFKAGKGAGISFVFDVGSEKDQDNTDIFGKDFAGASIRDQLISYARRASVANDDQVEGLRAALLESVGDRLDDAEKSALETHLGADYSGGLGKGESLKDPKVLAREIMRFPLTKREKALLSTKVSKKGSSLVPLRHFKDKRNNIWIEPVYARCPAVKALLETFGTPRPKGDLLKTDPRFEGLLYEPGWLVCRSSRDVCPYYEGAEAKVGITCMFRV